MQVKLLSVICLLFALNGWSQTAAVELDSIRNTQNDPWLHSKKAMFFMGFDSRNSFFAGRGVKVFGVRAGIQHYFKYRTGIGLYGITNGVTMQDVSVNRPDATDTSLTRYNLGFLVFFLREDILQNQAMGDFCACHFRLGESGGLLQRYIGYLPPALSCTFFFHQRRRVGDVQANPVDWCGYGYWLPMDIPWRARTQISLQHAILRAAIYRDVWRDIPDDQRRCAGKKSGKSSASAFKMNPV